MLGKSMLFFWGGLLVVWAFCLLALSEFFFGTSLTGSEGLKGYRLGETAVWPQAKIDMTTLCKVLHWCIDLSQRHRWLHTATLAWHGSGSARCAALGRQD
jgi:hypothetical protein